MLLRKELRDVQSEWSKEKTEKRKCQTKTRLLQEMDALTSSDDRGLRERLRVNGLWDGLLKEWTSLGHEAYNVCNGQRRFVAGFRSFLRHSEHARAIQEATSHLAEARAEYKRRVAEETAAVRAEIQRLVSEAKGKNPETLATFYRNMVVCELNRIGSVEWREFHDYYKKAFQNRKHSQRKKMTATRKARRQRELAALDGSVRGKINLINHSAVTCHWCGVFLPNGGQADHIVPISKGGKHAAYNLVASCRACNQSKADIMPDSPDMPVGNQFELPLL